MSIILFCELRWLKSKLATKIFICLDWVLEPKILILADRLFNPIQAGVFWNHIGWGGGTLCPPLFLLCLWSNYNETWHDSTLGQNLSKTIKILLTSSLGGKYDVIKLFLVLFQVKIRVSLSFVQWSWNVVQGSILRRWFRIRAKKFDINTFWRWKMWFFTKNWNFFPSTLWQKCCHGSTLGYC